MNEEISMIRNRETPVNIVLEGFMGVGKTTIGKKLAEQLDYRFVDTDDCVQQMAGKSIHDMLVDGELPLVREWENKACKALSELTETIIATGGGVFTVPENAELLRKKGFIVCLKRGFNKVFPLISGDPVRVMAFGKTYDELKTLWDSRMPLYEQYADLVINLDDADKARTQIIDAFRHFKTEMLFTSDDENNGEK